MTRKPPFAGGGPCRAAMRDTVRDRRGGGLQTGGHAQSGAAAVPSSGQSHAARAAQAERS
ncbi:hypothetical protein DID96_07965 [Burkholderia sp. Bp8963]|nr:hypothetical protein DID96_07965 [Burkholderia sp. Bp8963]